MKKLILITGLAKGGKSTTLKEFIGRKRLHKTFIKKVSFHKFHIFEKSNCDISIPCWLYQVYKIKEVDNLIGTFCIDTKNELCPMEILNMDFVIKELKKLNIDIYFYVLSNGRDTKVDMSKVDILKSEFGADKVECNNAITSDGNFSKDFEKYVEIITKNEE